MGHLGALWERDSYANRLPTAVCYARLSRYTKEFMDSQPLFTLSYFGGKYKKALGVLGSRSGRDFHTMYVGEVIKILKREETK